MTKTVRDPRDAWTGRFTDELRLRHIEEKHIEAALESIHEHLADSGETPLETFGDPREYAASLELPNQDEGYGRAITYAAIALAIVSFTVFGIAVTRWLGGEPTPAVIAWTLAGAIVLLGASMWMTVGIARHVVATTFRERFSGEHAGLWGRWAPVAIAIPWVFPIFVATIVFAGALRA